MKLQEVPLDSFSKIKESGVDLKMKVFKQVRMWHLIICLQLFSIRTILMTCLKRLQLIRIHLQTYLLVLDKSLHMKKEIMNNLFIRMNKAHFSLSLHSIRVQQSAKVATAIATKTFTNRQLIGLLISSL